MCFIPYDQDLCVEMKKCKNLLQEKLVANNYYLNQSAKEAYRSYLLSYNSHSMKEIFNVHRLDLQVCYLASFYGRYILLAV